MTTIRIFRYLDDLDCFVVSNEYKRIADELGLTEWSSVVWIGCLSRSTTTTASTGSITGTCASR
jgi:hypothetical protein